MRVLVDTGALLALNRTPDQYHSQAVAIARRHEASGNRYVGTTLILGELYSQLLYRRGPRHATEVLTRLLEDPAYQWAAVDQETVRSARSEWLVRFADQDFSLVDAVSFEVMKRERLTHAFAFDQHFVTAGFELLR